MAGIQNNISFSNGEKLQPSSADDRTDMQSVSTDVSRINYTGNPEGVISANPSSLCHDPVSGILYKKDSGAGNTGWVTIGGGGGGGGLVWLGSFDLSGLSSQAFVSMMSSTYRNYLLKVTNLYMSGSNRPRMVISQDNGATYLGGMGYAFFYGTMFGGSGFVSTGGGGQDSFYLSNNMQDSNNQPEANFDIQFFSGLGSNSFTYHGTGMQNDPVSGLAYNLPWGFYENLSPEINAIKLITESGTFQTGFASLYGYAETSSGGGGGFSTINIQKFTTSGTYTPTSGMKYCQIESVGGGAGGGGCDNPTALFYASAGGGGAGGYSRTISSAATIGVSQTVTIGAGGAGGAAGNNAGSNGGDTSVGALCIGKGGTGAVGSPGSTVTAGGAGGVAGTGDFTFPGGAGNCGQFVFNAYVLGTTSLGGNSYFGAGATSEFSAGGSGPGRPGSLYGGGGGGGLADDGVTNTAAGGDGAAGVVIITEYI